MKRLLAFLLVIVLALSFDLTAFAAGTDGTVSGGNNQGAASGQDAFGAMNDKTGQRILAGQTGQVDVCIGAALILESPVVFSVELADRMMPRRMMPGRAG